MFVVLARYLSTVLFLRKQQHAPSQVLLDVFTQKEVQSAIGYQYVFCNFFMLQELLPAILQLSLFLASCYYWWWQVRSRKEKLVTDVEKLTTDKDLARTTGYLLLVFVLYQGVCFTLEVMVAAIQFSGTFRISAISNNYVVQTCLPLLQLSFASARKNWHPLHILAFLFGMFSLVAVIQM